MRKITGQLEKSMFRNFIVTIALILVLAWAGIGNASTFTLKLSGAGAINDSTIKAGEKVSIDVYATNDKVRTGLTAGFKFISTDIKKIIHVADSVGGLNETGNVKGHNGWQDKSIFDFTGLKVPEADWDGNLPDIIGFGGAALKKGWQLQEEELKMISIEIIVPTTGTIVVDSSFWPPAGYWKFGNGDKPVWDGPYKFKVVK